MSRTVGILAGNGVLPCEIAVAVRESGGRPFIVAIADEAGPEVEVFNHERLDWGRLGNLFRLLAREGAEDVVFAGGISRRPNLRLDRLDWTTVKALPSLLTMLMSGDDRILSGLVSMFEDKGFRLVGLADVAPQLLLSNGFGTVSKRAFEQIALGRGIVEALGPFDVGQGTVVCGRRAVAVEGLEGTDAMLRRVQALRDTGRLRDQRDGVLVKVPKPGQERRVDLPAIGPRTVALASAAGLRGIAGEAGGMVILEREKTYEKIGSLGLFLHAIDP